MSLPRYPAYKNSEIPWVGQIPSGWSVRPLISTVLERSESNLGMREDNLLSLSYGRIVQKDIESNDGLLPESFETYQIIKPGDIVLRLTDLQNDKRSLRSAIVEEQGIITSAYLAIQPKGIESRFLAYLLRAYDLTKVFYSMGGGLRQSMKFSDMKRMPVVVPSRLEQVVIAAFLDRETAKIDALIAEQERLIALLAEKRQATISHTVTHGLNPNVPMKHSGVAWLGEVPKHWTVSRIKYLVQTGEGIQMGPFGGMLLDLSAQDTGYKVYGQENTISGDFTRGSRWISEERFKELERYCLCDGDLVLTRKGSLGNARLITKLPQPGICDSDTIRVRANENTILPVFLAMLLHEAGYIETQIAVSKRGAILSGVNSETIANLILAVPPLEEQQALIGSLEQQLSGFDACANEISRVIGLLKERRSALIAAAVTGQIDVRREVEAPAEQVEGVAA